ncbi:hypothetical protein K6Y31_09815 [Motilimonas cestriensis]|uniref:Uncharacterized protein n=1 Tax=Motilimonas cestriensis TaxID=2742685 RepID=A0ABS8WBE9_9GAMM|nr:hypothetical protein [Motilimonas cestriensis]MCE2595114.1 hypothetical protein [Motilimonas cestriensis]
MIKSNQLLVQTLEQLPQLFIANPDIKLMGLWIDESKTPHLLHALYLEKDDISEELPYRAQLAIGEWDNTDNSEEFFIEALTASRLAEKLKSFIDPEKFVFFEVPKSITIDVVNMYPDPMMYKLFPELGEFDATLEQQDLALARKQASQILSNLLERSELTI